MCYCCRYGQSAADAAFALVSDDVCPHVCTSFSREAAFPFRRRVWMLKSLERDGGAVSPLLKLPVLLAISGLSLSSAHLPAILIFTSSADGPECLRVGTNLRYDLELPLGGRVIDPPTFASQTCSV